jgi:hypothetical protein
MTQHTSSVVLLIGAAVFYIPVLISLMVLRRSWMDVFAIGAVATILCVALDALLPPFGLVAFGAFHAGWIFIWLRSVVRSRRHKHDHAA